MENQIFKIPVIKANNAWNCDREIDETLDFYDLKDFFHMKKECKRFSKVDLDILILMAKNINSKAWLYRLESYKYNYLKEYYLENILISIFTYRYS